MRLNNPMPPPGMKHRGMMATWWRGYEAAEAGQPQRDNPYQDRKSFAGHVTFSRAWMRAWDDGWETYRVKKET